MKDKLVKDYLVGQLELLCDCAEILDHVRESLPEGSVMRSLTMNARTSVQEAVNSVKGMREMVTGTEEL